MNKHNITGVILAGGASKRLGRDKVQLTLGHQRMIDWIIEALDCVFEEVLVVTNNPGLCETIKVKDVKCVGDAMNTPVRNSMLGIYSGLVESRNERIFVVPCDMPLLNQKLIEYMIGQLGNEDIYVPFISPHYQPLHAFYRKSCIPVMKKYILKEHYKIIDLYDEVMTKKVHKEEIDKFDPDLHSFHNVNTEKDYEKLLELWEKNQPLWAGG